MEESDKGTAIEFVENDKDSNLTKYVRFSGQKLNIKRKKANSYIKILKKNSDRVADYDHRKCVMCLPKKCLLISKPSFEQRNYEDSNWKTLKFKKKN